MWAARLAKATRLGLIHVGLTLLIHVGQARSDPAGMRQRVSLFDIDSGNELASNLLLLPSRTTAKEKLATGTRTQHISPEDRGTSLSRKVSPGRFMMATCEHGRAGTRH